MDVETIKTSFDKCSRNYQSIQPSLMTRSLSFLAIEIVSYHDKRRRLHDHIYRHHHNRRNLPDHADRLTGIITTGETFLTMLIDLHAS
jgi:hypothetical protein